MDPLPITLPNRIQTMPRGGFSLGGYKGGKCGKIARRVSEKILGFVGRLQGRRFDGYTEPLCGMCSVGFDLLRGGLRLPCSFSDWDPDLILMWQSIQKNWIPQDYYTELEFERLKKSHVPSAERGYVGFTFSYGGDKFQGHKARYQGESKTRSVALNNKAKIPQLRHITRGSQFTQRSYEELNPKNQIIYCDPPYKDTGGNSVNLRGFDHDSFWSTMRDWSRNNLVFVSEHEGNAPPDWKRILREPVRRKMTTRGSQQVMDCLFVHQTWMPVAAPKVISVSSSRDLKPQTTTTISQPAMSALQKQTLQTLQLVEAKRAQVQKHKAELELQGQKASG